METHAAQCANCRNAVQAEQGLRRDWQNLPTSPALPDLWPQLAGRLQGKSTPPRWIVALRPTAALTTAGALALIMLVQVVPRSRQFVPQLPVVMPADRRVTPAEEQQLAQQISRVQSSLEEESDSLLTETGHSQSGTGSGMEIEGGSK